MVKADFLAKMDGVVCKTVEADLESLDTSWDQAPARIAESR